LIIRRIWAELPDEVRQEVERRCGRVLVENPATAGRHSEFSATLDTAGAGRVFVKGITIDHPQAGGHRHEVYVNPWLPDVAPRLSWTVEAGGWLMLGFEYLPGRHADLAPGSDDLAMITDAVSVMAEALRSCQATQVPVLAEQWSRLVAWRRLSHDPPTDLHPWSRANLDRFVQWEQRAFQSIRGDSLAHTDLHPLNMIIDESARIVDWAWSRQAAAWVDTGFLVLRLIRSGHSPIDAERWAGGISVWGEASESDRTAFAIGVLGLWEFLQRDQPLPHRPQLTNAARHWAKHRLGLH
jgi:hypothetical protein